MAEKEIVLTLPGGLSLAAITWGDPASVTRILCVHGWMDNCQSYALLGPALAAGLGAYVIALDLPGHGHSGHRPPTCYYGIAEYAANVVEVWQHALGWTDGLLVGHSLGAGICSLAAAVLEPAVSGLMLLDGLGPYTRPASETVVLFRRAMVAKSSAMAKEGSVYPSLQTATEQRVATVARFPGKQRISLAAARRLVEHALVPAGATEAADPSPSPAPSAAAPSPSSCSDDAGSAAATKAAGFRFRHDRRIAGPSLTYLSEEQVLAFLAGIRCPVLLLVAEEGWPVPAEVATARIAAVPDITVVRLPGSHHLHLDEDTSPAVAAAMLHFATDKVKVPLVPAADASVL